jgi:hypothetical protein
MARNDSTQPENGKHDDDFANLGHDLGNLVGGAFGMAKTTFKHNWKFIVLGNLAGLVVLGLCAWGLFELAAAVFN